MACPTIEGIPAAAEVGDVGEVYTFLFCSGARDTKEVLARAAAAATGDLLPRLAKVRPALSWPWG